MRKNDKEQADAARARVKEELEQVEAARARIKKEQAELRQRVKELAEPVLREKDRAGERLWEYEKKRLKAEFNAYGSLFLESVIVGTALMATASAVLSSAEHRELKENPAPAIEWARERVTPECEAQRIAETARESFEACIEKRADSLISQRMTRVEEVNANARIAAPLLILLAGGFFFPTRRELRALSQFKKNTPKP